MRNLINIHLEKQKSFLHAIELFLACVVILGVVATFVYQVPIFLSSDWTQMTTFIEFMEFILHLAVGVELARLLISYNMNTVIELLVFVIARKILLFEESSLELVLLVFAVMLLFMGRFFFIQKYTSQISKKE